MKRIFLLILMTVSYGIIASDQNKLLAQMAALAKEKEEKPVYEILALRDTKKAQKRFLSTSEPTSDFDKKLKERLEEYEKADKALALFNDVVEGKHGNNIFQTIFTQASMCGGINYTMNIDEMKKKIQEVFAQWEKEGLIISQQEFEKIKEKYFVPPSGPTKSLDRVWGALYLKKRFEADPNLKERYDVPKFIVVYENTGPIQVKLFLTGRGGSRTSRPCVDVLKNAKVYFEKIDAFSDETRISKSTYDDIGPSSLVGYDDFSGKGNILGRVDDKRYVKYVVDTESRVILMPFINEKVATMLYYLEEKFKLQNPDYSRHDNEIITIELQKDLM